MIAELMAEPTLPRVYATIEKISVCNPIRSIFEAILSLGLCLRWLSLSGLVWSRIVDMIFMVSF